MTESKPLKWRRVGPQDYRATLPDGTEAQVSGHFVDDRAYDGGTLTGWQWGARVGGEYITDHWHDRMYTAKAAVHRHAHQVAVDKAADTSGPEPVTITVLAEDVFNGVGRTRPFSTLYTCTGPDGVQFDNTNVKTLRDVLRRRYGKVELAIDDQTAGQIVTRRRKQA